MSSLLISLTALLCMGFWGFSAIRLYRQQELAPSYSVKEALFSMLTIISAVLAGASGLASLCFFIKFLVDAI